MKIKVYINTKLYKTWTVLGNSYDPNALWPEIQIDRDSGALSSFDLSTGIHLRFERVPEY